MSAYENQKYLNDLMKLQRIQKNLKTVLRAILWTMVIVAAIALVQYLLTNMGDILWMVTTPIVNLIS